MPFISIIELCNSLSNELQKKKKSTFDKKIPIEFKNTKNSLKHLCAKRFACEPHVKIAEEEWILSNPKLIFNSYRINQVRKHPEKKTRVKK